MKQDVMPSIVQMDQETLKKLTTEVRETLATGYSLAKSKKQFSLSESLEYSPGLKTASRLPENGESK